jgi:hypothetical protein
MVRATRSAHGWGKENGKGCYLRTISRALGDYALSANPNGRPPSCAG